MQNTAAEKDFLTTSCCERIKWRLRNAKKILMLSRQCGWLRVRVGYIIAKNDCYKYELQDKHKNGNCVFKYLQRYKQVAHTHTYCGAWTSSSIIAHFFYINFSAYTQTFVCAEHPWRHAKVNSHMPLSPLFQATSRRRVHKLPF